MTLVLGVRIRLGRQSLMNERSKLYLEENKQINVSRVNILRRGVEWRGGCKNILESIVEA